MEVLRQEIEAEISTQIEERILAELEVKYQQQSININDKLVKDAITKAVAQAIQSEKQHSINEMNNLRQSAKEILIRERKVMNDKIRQMTKQVREWMVRQQQEQLLKQAAVLQEEAERFGINSGGGGGGGQSGVGRRGPRDEDEVRGSSSRRATSGDDGDRMKLQQQQQQRMQQQRRIQQQRRQQQQKKQQRLLHQQSAAEARRNHTGEDQSGS